MQEKSREYIRKAKVNKKTSKRLAKVVVCLSLVVILGVFWGLKLTGITLAGQAHCGKIEHKHSAECQTKTLICELEETTQTQEAQTQDGTDTEQTTEISSAHTHTDECYEIVNCELEEHIHTTACYSDVSADLETSDDWEATLADITRSQSTAENVVAVAKSQLGYKESTKNFEVDASGEIHGITRYGQWYGNNYGEWSAMFVSFCLEYGGASDAPVSAGAESMRLEWNKEGLYKSAKDYSAKVGNLVFISSVGKATADSVGIITNCSDNSFTAIQGDYENEVKEVKYSLNGEKIVGYGILPESSSGAVMMAAPKNSVSIALATNFTTSMLSSTDRFVFYTTDSSGNTYAIDGTGKAVQVYVDESGRVYTESENPDELLWTFSRYNYNTYAIQNVGNGRYLHPYYNSATDNGITTPGRWGTSVQQSNTGLKFSHSAYIVYDELNNTFKMSRTQSQNQQFSIGVSSRCSVWLDGTNGGIMAYNGSDDTRYEAYTNSTLVLPTEWKSPAKYDYVLNGWYDVVNNKYYSPGEKVIVTGNTVFYADWKARSYDVGQFNSLVDDETVSTNSFITTRVFDYSVLFNVLSQRANVNITDTSHTETWQLLTSGNNPYNAEQTLNFILRDWDRGNEDISYPNGHNAINNPTDAGEVYQGLYNERLRDLLFDPDTQSIGKTYLGEGDHLFQLCEDKSHDHYGYYYYNSERNAASYNQSDSRFYVYDYLEATSDTVNNEESGIYSDFLPFNSPYANSNSKTINTYNCAGVDNEYVGTTHYKYDSKYNTDGNSTNNVGTNFWFGMSIDIDFYLPNAPGAQIGSGGYGNQDIYGKDMHFRFAGDDDVWVLIDGKLVLDLGGLHGKEGGDINFSTGVVTINGVQNTAFTNTLKSFASGEHTLTLYYLERGSSRSNCAIYFNLAPRFEFSIQKEDVLTRDVLNGAEFSVFTDRECTIPAQLWTSKQSNERDEPSTNVFKVVDGVARMWGMGAGNTYYIKETKPPDNADYGYANGIICLEFDKYGTANYNVEIIEDEGGVSAGFIVHGFRIDTETQQAYIIATNAPKWAKETTSVQAMKKWNDTLDHSDQEVTVYLTVTNSDGSVTRLQEAVLNAENNWNVTWDNLPKYNQDKTLVKYGVAESYVSGYYSSVEEQKGQFVVEAAAWQPAATFENGKVYLLKNSSGLCLSTLQSAQDTGFKWVSEQEAELSTLAKWTASVSGSRVRFTNQAGQTLTFWYGNGSPTDFFALNQHIEDNDRKQYLTYSKTSAGFTLRYNNYYVGASLNSSQKFVNTQQSGSALLVTPYFKTTTSSTVPIVNQGFMVTNTPIEKETKLSVRKQWVVPSDMNETAYQQEKVTVRLYANGVDTGRSIELSLKNNFTGEFKGLSYVDSDGKEIKYTVKENVNNDKWVVTYGEVSASSDAIPTYSTVITNTLRTGGPILPATGSFARILYILCGLSIVLCSLIYGIWYKHRRERRIK